MILYGLVCSHDHRFEAWFSNSNAFGEQQAAGRITCPFCDDSDVSKAPMAPRIGRLGRGREDSAQNDTAPEAGEVTPAVPRLPSDLPLQEKFEKLIAALHQDVRENCEYVGGKFVEEARAIHYGEADGRGIYGEASKDDAASLAEEGIDIAPIPWMRRPNA